MDARATVHMWRVHVFNRVCSGVQYLPCDEVFEAHQFISVLWVLLIVLFGEEGLIRRDSLKLMKNTEYVYHWSRLSSQ